MAAGKLCLIEATGQGRAAPVQPLSRKEEWQDHEKEVISKHWKATKEVLDEILSEVPEELSFPDLPPAPRPREREEKPLPRLPPPAPSFHQAKQDSRRPRPANLNFQPSPPSRSGSSTGSQRQDRGVPLRMATYPPAMIPLSAPAHVSTFSTRPVAPPRGSGSYPKSIPILTYVPAPPAPQHLGPQPPSRQERSNSESVSFGSVGFIPTLADLAHSQAFLSKSAPYIPALPAGMPVAFCHTHGTVPYGGCVMPHSGGSPRVAGGFAMF